MNCNVDNPVIVKEEKHEYSNEYYLNDKVGAIKEEKYNEIKVKCKIESVHDYDENEYTDIQQQQTQNNGHYGHVSGIKQEKHEIRNYAKENEFTDKNNHKTQNKKDKKDVAKKNKYKASVERDVKNVYCGICDFTSKCSVEVNHHFLKHCQENVLNCQLCSFEGKDVAHMVSHRYDHCPKSDKQKYECPMCSEQFHADFRLQYHYRSVHLKTKGGMCIICGKAFLDMGRWRTHEKEHFTINFTCDHCGKGFLQRYKIIEHLAVHYNTFKCICSYCGKGFRKSGNLKCHIIACHRTEDPATCTICSRKYKNNSMLKRHMYEEHAQRKHICQTCFKGFCTKRNLEKHIYNYHSAIKPFACELCNSRYRASWSLKSHMRTHTGELPYTCQECGKMFNNSSTMKRHQSVHTGVRAVKCGHCDKTFHTKKKMLTHCNSKHRDIAVVSSGEEVTSHVVFVKEERE